MKKKLLVGGLIASLIIGGLGLIGLRTGLFKTPKVNADSGIESVEENDQEPNYSATIKVNEKDFATEEDESNYLAQFAKITSDEAVKSALNKVSGTLSGKPILENENGNLVYSVPIKIQSGELNYVKVDAGNGNVIYIEKVGNEQKEDEGNEINDGIDNDNIEEVNIDTVENNIP